MFRRNCGINFKLKISVMLWIYYFDVLFEVRYRFLCRRTLGKYWVGTSRSRCATCFFMGPSLRWRQNVRPNVAFPPVRMQPSKHNIQPRCCMFHESTSRHIRFRTLPALCRAFSLPVMAGQSRTAWEPVFISHQQNTLELISLWKNSNWGAWGEYLDLEEEE